MTSKLEDLIAKLCPNGVEYHSLEELFVIKNGYTPSKSNSEFWTDGNVPWFRMDDIRAHGRVLSDSIQHVTKSAVKGGKLFPANSIILATTATIGEHALVIVDSLANQQFTFFSKRELLSFDLDMKYVFYYFFIIDEWCKRNVNAASFASVDMPRLRKLEIPVPPLDVQAEIVRILDTFTELTENLTTELTARSKQYEYYRDTLLTFDDNNPLHSLISRYCLNGVEYHSLEELFVIKNGYTPSKSNSEFWTDGNVPWFRMDDIRAHGRVLSDSIQHVTKSAVKGGKLFPANSIILATTATIGEHALVIVDSLANQQFTFFSKRELLSFDLDMKYVFYYFFIIDEWCKRNVNAASFASVDMPRLRKLEIPIPPLEVQRQIVKILDCFDALCNDLTKGLPAEIEARRKQYEYYRDQLLNFKRA